MILFIQLNKRFDCRNTDTDGYTVFINQGNLGHSVDRGQVTIEFIENWAIGTGVIGSAAVEPQGKLTILWGTVKMR